MRPKDNNTNKQRNPQKYNLSLHILVDKKNQKIKIWKMHKT